MYMNFFIDPDISFINIFCLHFLLNHSRFVGLNGLLLFSKYFIARFVYSINVYYIRF